MTAPVACIYKGYLYMAHEFPNGIPANSTALYSEIPAITEDEIEARLGHEPLNYRRGFSDGVEYAETIHLHKNKP